MQIQSERTETSLAEMRKMLLMANEENSKRAKKIETLGKSLTSLRVLQEALRHPISVHL